MTKAKKQTTNLSKKYINDVKVLFPVIRKKEKVYLQHMRQNIDDYCENEIVSSMEELYEEFGKPQDIVYNYYSIIDTEQLFLFIRLRRILKYFLTFVSCIIFAVTIFYCTILYQEHLVFMDAKPMYIETEIIDSKEIYP